MPPGRGVLDQAEGIAEREKAVEDHDRSRPLLSVPLELSLKEVISSLVLPEGERKLLKDLGDPVPILFQSLPREPVGGSGDPFHDHSTFFAGDASLEDSSDLSRVDGKVPFRIVFWRHSGSILMKWERKVNVPFRQEKKYLGKVLLGIWQGEGKVGERIWLVRFLYDKVQGHAEEEQVLHEYQLYGPCFSILLHHSERQGCSSRLLEVFGQHPQECRDHLSVLLHAVFEESEAPELAFHRDHPDGLFGVGTDALGEDPAEIVDIDQFVLSRIWFTHSAPVIPCIFRESMICEMLPSKDFLL